MWFRRLTIWDWSAAGVLGVLLGAFALFPALDIKISTVFYVPGHGFPWSNSGLGLFVKRYVPEIIIASLLGCVIVWGAGLVRKRQHPKLSTRKIAYLMTTLVVGPGLIVESLIKPNSGRARPNDLSMFAGQHEYTLPMWPANACASNCSFVSGHAAVAFWLTAYAFIVPPQWRRVWLAFGIAVGLAVGMVRVMQGAHFASDVLYAGFIVVIVNLVLARVMLQRKDQAIDAAAAQA